MVLFDKARIAFTMFGAAMTRHRRIKILNEKGKEQGDVKIEYHNIYGVDEILNLDAQTINLENGKIVITKIDPKLVYNQHTDKSKDALVFSFPNVRAGSVIEYRYTLVRHMSTNFPAWYFQSDIPTRYSEFTALFDPNIKLKALTRVTEPFFRDSLVADGHLWAMRNVRSSKTEAYMRSEEDARESLSILVSAVSVNGKTQQLFDTWQATGKLLSNEKGYFKELDQSLSDESSLVKTAMEMPGEDARIAYIYNQVKSRVSWNGMQNWVSNGGIKNAWKKRSGNSAEINAMVYHLLKKCGIKAYPMLVSTRDNGELSPDFANIFQLNNLVTYVPVDSTKYYLLDASDKYDRYNQIPYNLLNSYGLYLNNKGDNCDMIFIETKKPYSEIILVSAEIGSDAKMKGSTQIVSSGYDKLTEAQFYNTEGEQKFEQYLTGSDNNIRISDLKLDNMDVDTLPLKQSFNFTYDLNNSDNYVYFTPNMFTSLHDNPFMSENRNSSIDFGYRNDKLITGNFKLPAGYTLESLPKSTSIVMSDKSITFKRALQMDDGYISFHYEIVVKRTRFAREEYPAVHEFFKKMYELLNEQIVLRKT